MDMVSSHLRRYPNARPETIQHLVRKQEKLQQLRDEMKPKPVSAYAAVFRKLARAIGLEARV
jgi:hypothetical protein